MATAVMAEKLVYKRPEALRDVETHYCPGCTHGIAHRLIAEVLDELGVRERTIGVAPVGCAVFAYEYFNVDGTEAAHGRAPAMATGIKRVLPDHIVFTYQGDGDLAAIGTAEIVHVAVRGENITTIFINNAIYGMTGGQMAPTTLPNQVTTSSPEGRSVSLTGYPVRMSELLAHTPGAARSRGSGRRNRPPGASPSSSTSAWRRASSGISSPQSTARRWRGGRAGCAMPWAAPCCPRASR